MGLYNGLSVIFPGSFTAKIFFIAFLGTHLPLIALVTWLLTAGPGLAGQLDTVVLILLSTLVGTVATLAALHAILQPVHMLKRQLERFEEAGEIVDVKVRGQDEMGDLMARAGRLMRRVTVRLEESRKTADTDPLTGVLNRRGFDRAVPAEGRGAVLHIDLDHFKGVNDSLGHDEGDRVLRDVARVVASTLRKSDTLARFGGEEFVVFLPGAPKAIALEIAERVRYAILSEVRAGDKAVSASIGVSTAEATETIADLIRHADEATYASKRGGRNRVTLHQGERA